MNDEDKPMNEEPAPHEKVVIQPPGNGLDLAKWPIYNVEQANSDSAPIELSDDTGRIVKYGHEVWIDHLEEDKRYKLTRIDVLNMLDMLKLPGGYDEPPTIPPGEEIDMDNWPAYDFDQEVPEKEMRISHWAQESGEILEFEGMEKVGPTRGSLIDDYGMIRKEGDKIHVYHPLEGKRFKLTRIDLLKMLDILGRDGTAY